MKCHQTHICVKEHMLTKSRCISLNIVNNVTYLTL